MNAKSEIKENFMAIRQSYHMNEAVIAGAIILSIVFSNLFSNTQIATLIIVTVLIMFAVHRISALLIDLRQDNQLHNEEILHYLSNIRNSSLDSRMYQKATLNLLDDYMDIKGYKKRESY